MNDTFSIKGKVAIVTGGGGVLGGSIAKHLVGTGCKVVVLDIREENVNSRVEELKQMGGEAVGFVSNVLDVEEMKEIDAVTISTPDHVHGPAAKFCMGSAG
ncbi:MAG: hypothetical protein RLZZ184_3107, partial [Cyanobacteriota bacterium]